MLGCSEIRDELAAGRTKRHDPSAQALSSIPEKEVAPAIPINMV